MDRLGFTCDRLGMLHPSTPSVGTSALISATIPGAIPGAQRRAHLVVGTMAHRERSSCSTWPTRFGVLVAQRLPTHPLRSDQYPEHREEQSIPRGFLMNRVPTTRLRRLRCLPCQDHIRHGPDLRERQDHTDLHLSEQLVR